MATITGGEPGVSIPPDTRSQRLKKTYWMSLLSKIGSLAVFALVQPYVVREIGPTKFGLHATIVSGIAWVGMLGLGTGPALTKAIAFSWGRENQADQRAAFRTAGVITACAAMFIAVGLSLFAIGGGFVSYAGRGLGDQLIHCRNLVLLMAVCLPLNLLTQNAEFAYAGYQKNYVPSLWALITSLLTAPSLWFVAHFAREIEWYGAALMVPMTVTKVGCYIALRREVPYLFGRFHVNRETVRSFALSGIALSVNQAAWYLHTQFLGWFVPHLRPEFTTPYGFLVTVFVPVWSVVGSIISPIWPAIAEAQTSGDVAWASRAIRRLLRTGVILAATSLIGALCLPLIADRLFGLHLAIPFSTAVAFGLYIGSCVAESTITSLALAFRHVRVSTTTWLIRSGALVLVIPVIVKLGCGIAGVLLLDCGLTLLGTLYLLVRLRASLFLT